MSKSRPAILDQKTVYILNHIMAGDTEQQIGDDLGISKQAVSDRLKRSGISLFSLNPRGFITVKKFAKKQNINCRTVLSMIRAARIPSVMFRGRYYIPQNSFIPCARCGRHREKGKQYCEDCRSFMTLQTHKRQSFRILYLKTRGTDLPPCLQLLRHKTA